jgi:hypothetical protein
MLKAYAAVLLIGVFAVSATAQAAPTAKCTQLSCPRCESVCRASCEADTIGKRGGAYRGCANGCKSELCAQCLPVQYDAKDRKFLPMARRRRMASAAAR